MIGEIFQSVANEITGNDDGNKQTLSCAWGLAATPIGGINATGTAPAPRRAPSPF